MAVIVRVLRDLHGSSGLVEVPAGTVGTVVDKTGPNVAPAVRCAFVVENQTFYRWVTVGQIAPDFEIDPVELVSLFAVNSTIQIVDYEFPPEDLVGDPSTGRVRRTRAIRLQLASGFTIHMAVDRNVGGLVFSVTSP